MLIKKIINIFILIIFFTNTVLANSLVHKIDPINLPKFKKNNKYIQLVDWSKDYLDLLDDIQWHARDDNLEIGINIYNEYINKYPNITEEKWLSINQYLNAHLELARIYLAKGSYKKAISISDQIIKTYDIKNFKGKPNSLSSARRSIYNIEFFRIKALMASGDSYKACILIPDYKKRMNSTFGDKTKIYFINKFYKDNKCSKILGELEGKSVEAPKNSEKTLSGFKIDLRENNEFIRSNFSEYSLIFDFSKFIVSQKINSKDINIDNTYEIIQIDKKKIVFQQNLKEYWIQCQKEDDDHRYKYCNEYAFDFLRFRNIQPKTPDQTRRLEDKKIPIDELKLYETKEDWIPYHPLKNYDLSAPAVYLEYDFKRGNLKTTIWPSASAPYKQTFNSDSNLTYDSENLEKAIKILIFIATVYLLVNQIKDIKSIAKSSGNSNKVTGKSSTFSNTKNFGNRSIQEKVKIFKYYRMYGF